MCTQRRRGGNPGKSNRHNVINFLLADGNLSPSQPRQPSPSPLSSSSRQRRPRPTNATTGRSASGGPNRAVLAARRRDEARAADRVSGSGSGSGSDSGSDSGRRLVVVVIAVGVKRNDNDGVVLSRQIKDFGRHTSSEVQLLRVRQIQQHLSGGGRWLVSSSLTRSLTQYPSSINQSHEQTTPTTMAPPSLTSIKTNFPPKISPVVFN